MEAVAEQITNRPLTERPAWKVLEANYQKVRKLHLRQLFSDEPDRGERLTLTGAGVYLDLLEESHNRRNAQASLPTRDRIGIARQN